MQTVKDSIKDRLTLTLYSGDGPHVRHVLPSRRPLAWTCYHPAENGAGPLRRRPQSTGKQLVPLLCDLAIIFRHWRPASTDTSRKVTSDRSRRRMHHCGPDECAVRPRVSVLQWTLPDCYDVDARTSELQNRAGYGFIQLWFVFASNCCERRQGLPAGQLLPPRQQVKSKTVQ